MRLAHCKGYQVAEVPLGGVTTLQAEERVEEEVEMLEEVMKVGVRQAVNWMVRVEEEMVSWVVRVEEGMVSWVVRVVEGMVSWVEVEKGVWEAVVRVVKEEGVVEKVVEGMGKRVDGVPQGVVREVEEVVKGVEGVEGVEVMESWVEVGEG